MLLVPLVLMFPGANILMSTLAYDLDHRYGQDPVVGDKFVVAKSCARVGPITMDYLGCRWECLADGPRGEQRHYFLTPADIGEQVPVVERTKHASRSRSVIKYFDRASVQPHPARRWAPIVGWFGWIGLIVGLMWVAVLLMGRFFPGHAIKIARPRRVRVGPERLSFSKKGLRWDGCELPWREVREARLVGDVLHLKPLVGEVVTIGPFTGKGLTVVHESLELFLRNRYRDERVGSAK